MGTLVSPIELPTSRNSYQQVENGGDDMKNPQWIPFLRKVESQYDPSKEKELSPYTGASFSPTPTYTAGSPEQRPKLSSIHSYSRSSVAPETLELEVASPPSDAPPPTLPPVPQQSPQQMNFELPATRPTSRYFEKAHITGMPGDATLTDTETTVDRSRSESNAGTSTMTQDSPPAQSAAAIKDETPVQGPPAVEEEIPSLYPRSPRSSLYSTKKLSIGPPTSKFNRKSMPALPPRIPSLQPEANGQSAAPVWKTTPAHGRTQTPAPSPPPAAAQPQLVNLLSASSKQAPSLRPTHSNASHASHSFSGNCTPADPPVTQETQSPPRGLRESTASVKSEQAKSDRKGPTLSSPQVATNEDSTQCVVGKTEPTRVITKAQAARPEKPKRVRLAPPPKPNPGAGISSFMTANETVIFRRFDKVHVQLLLCLQDEITKLERKLMRLESAVMTRSDRDIERSKVIRELRKVVAEYDHLFSSWSQMQANKVSEATQQSLRTWLQRPSTSAGAAMKLKDEIKWAEESKDLSAVSLAQKNSKTSGGGLSNFMGGICGKRQ